MKHYFRLTTLLLLIMLAASPAPAIMYSFAGYCRCTYGTPIAGETVLVRYVYTFDGVEPHEGRAYVETNSDGLYQLDRDITNIWGNGPLLSVVAWAWAREDERYMAGAQPLVTNYFEPFEWNCGKNPDYPPPHEEGAREPDDPVTWGQIKAQYR